MLLVIEQGRKGKSEGRQEEMKEGRRRGREEGETHKLGRAGK